MSDYAATEKYTTLGPDALAASLRAVEGVSVVATVNEDGTPNAAIFVPMMPDASHVVMTLARNRTRENLERTGHAVLVYDVASPHAAEKAERHCGVRMRLSLVSPDESEHAEVAALWPHMTPFTMILGVDEVEPLG